MPPMCVTAILNPNILPEEIEGKQIVLDILACGVDGARFNVEMQLRHYQHWPQRNIYYVASSLAKQLEQGQDYRHLKPCIGISLLAHDLFQSYPEKACWHFSLRDTEQPSVQLGESLQVHIIELRKAERLRSLPPALSAWIACLQHSLKDDLMSQITHPPVKEALQHLETLYSDLELRLMAERRARAIVDEQDALEYAHTEGVKQGTIAGRVALLSQLLTQKFGPLPPAVQQRISTASEKELGVWALNTLNANTLEEALRN